MGSRYTRCLSPGNRSAYRWGMPNLKVGVGWYMKREWNFFTFLDQSFRDFENYITFDFKFGVAVPSDARKFLDLTVIHNLNIICKGLGGLTKSPASESPAGYRKKSECWDRSTIDSKSLENALITSPHVVFVLISTLVKSKLWSQLQVCPRGFTGVLFLQPPQVETTAARKITTPRLYTKGSSSCLRMTTAQVNFLFFFI